MAAHAFDSDPAVRQGDAVDEVAALESAARLLIAAAPAADRPGLMDALTPVLDEHSAHLLSRASWYSEFRGARDIVDAYRAADSEPAFNVPLMVTLDPDDEVALVWQPNKPRPRIHDDDTKVEPQPQATRKLSVSLPADLEEELRARTGRGNVSPYIAAAVRRQLERDRLADLVEWLQEENGPVSEAVQAEVDAEWPSAE